MPNYDEIKKKAKDALETIADVSVEAYKIAEEKARVFARKAKLTAEITREKALIRRLKLDIGGTYYDLHKDDPEDALKGYCESITSSLDSIASKRIEIEDLKRSGMYDDEAEVDEAEADEAEVDEADAEIEDEIEIEVKIEVEGIEPDPADEDQEPKE